MLCCPKHACCLSLPSKHFNELKFGAGVLEVHTGRCKWWAFGYIQVVTRNYRNKPCDKQCKISCHEAVGISVQMTSSTANTNTCKATTQRILFQKQIFYGEFHNYNSYSLHLRSTKGLQTKHQAIHKVSGPSHDSHCWAVHTKVGKLRNICGNSNCCIVRILNILNSLVQCLSSNIIFIQTL